MADRLRRTRLSRSVIAVAVVAGLGLDAAPAHALEAADTPAPEAAAPESAPDSREPDSAWAPPPLVPTPATRPDLPATSKPASAARLDSLSSMKATGAAPPGNSGWHPKLMRRRSSGPRRHPTLTPLPREISRANPEAAAPDDDHWYGGQIIAADATSFLMLVVAVGGESEQLGIGALLTYALGGPAVHVGHGEPVRALASLGLRCGLPLSAAAMVTSNKSDLETTAESLFLGAGTAAFLDAMVLAHESMPQKRGLQLAPVVSAGDHRGWLGVRGSF